MWQTQTPGGLPMAALALALLAPLATGHAATPSPTGLWYDEPGKAAIQIDTCGEALCGRIVWLRKPRTDAGKPLLDIRNKDEAERSRPICGLKLLSGFHPASEAGTWEDGTIYNPEDGATYKSTMHLADDGTLRVRGYVGIPLFGKSETWTRAPAGLPPC